MNLQILNPLEVPDWDALLLRSNNHAFFHSAAWAKTLEATYGFNPIYFAATADRRLTLSVPFMEVCSPFTGRRGVSLPFTDQCAPFFMDKDDLKECVENIIDYGSRARWRYAEWRDERYFGAQVPPSDIYLTHDLNLTHTEQELFSLLKDTNRRNIRKANRAGVTVRIEQSLNSLESFYRLNCITRKRHGLPPQPFSFFKNLFYGVLATGYGIVVSAVHSTKTIAASVFFNFGTTALYKYGASDLHFQSLRPNNLIMWEAIRWYKSKGCTTLSLGRTELNNHGLLNFKRSWGATESTIRYYRYNFKKDAYLPYHSKNDLHNRILARTPVGILRILGRLAYRHMG
jgi:hypothetical protein